MMMMMTRRTMRMEVKGAEAGAGEIMWVMGTRDFTL